MPYLKPLPQVLDEHRPFWEGLREREFRIPYCSDCGAGNWPPYPACRRCLGEHFDWRPTDGHGEVYSFTVVRRGPGAFQDDVPYVVALVRLRDMHGSSLVLGRVSVDDTDTVAVGTPVVVDYEDVPGEDLTLWSFVPSA